MLLSRVTVFASGAALIVLVLTSFLTGCQVSQPRYDPAPAQLKAQPVTDFDDYLSRVGAHLQAHRMPVEGFDPDDQLAWNLPFERLPAAHCDTGTKPQVGILLVHGLSDSPFVFRDMAGALAERCIRVRTLLLQGHGTRPGDLVAARAAVWRDQVRQHFQAFADGVDHAFIGGFSLGGALATELALQENHSDQGSARPAGLLALAPAWELNGLRDYLWMAPYAALVRDFVEEEPELNPVKYESLAINAAVQIGEVRSRVQAILESRRTIELPLMLVATEADSVINLPFLVEQFQRRFVHPANRMLVYRDTRRPGPGDWDQERILSLNSYLPEWRVREFSHMALPISSTNPLYGRAGPLNRCLEPNGLTLADCQALADDQLWFGAWQPQALEVATSRLTYNPHFDRFIDELVAFMERATP